jgi:hypothetical protein
MDAEVHLGRLLALIAPHYGGSPPKRKGLPEYNFLIKLDEEILNEDK